jgi:hypothetical protein
MGGDGMNEMKKFTQGTWIFEPHNGYGGEDPDGEPWPFGYVSTNKHTPIFELSPILDFKFDELLANARLIAAAPDLYAALASLRETCAALLEGDTCEAVVSDIDNVLKKARGES